MKGGADIKDGDLKAGSSVDVNLGPVHGSTSASTSIGKSGYSTHNSESSSFGNSLGSSHNSSESVGKKGVSVRESKSQNLFGFKTEEHTRLDVNKKGVSFGDHSTIAGHKFGYSATIPNPGSAIKENLREFKHGSDEMTSNSAHLISAEAASVASQAAKLASSLGHFAERMANNVGKAMPKDMSKTAGELARNAGHLAVEAGKVAHDVGKVVVPLICEIAKLVK